MIKAYQKLAGAVFSTASVYLLVSGSALADTKKPSGVDVNELRKHNKPDDLWITANGKVYNLTDFKDMHPGGAKILEKYAGKNASQIFNKHHAPDIPDEMLEEDQKLGPLIGELEDAGDITDKDAGKRAEAQKNKPPLSHIITPSDFEYVAKRLLSPTAWAYYSSAATDQVTYRENHNAYGRIFFKPRVCVDVAEVDMTTTMLGQKTNAPFYCSAAAQAKLGHPDGEKGIARGCGLMGIIQMVSNYASIPLEEIAGQIPHQIQWFQLYTKPDLPANFKTIDNAIANQMKAIFVTADTPELGRREKDIRLKTQMGLADDSSGVAANLSTHSNFSTNHPVTWDLVKQWQEQASVPVVLKGVGSVEDIVLAAEKGVKAVVLSNHGGRQLDFARAPVEVLADAMPVLRQKGLDDKIEIYIDGGVRRGADILKAVALGARGVGLGRLFLYANSAYGEEGVKHLCGMLMDEIKWNMQMLGVTRLDQLNESHVDIRNLHSRSPVSDAEYYRDFEPVSPPYFKNEIAQES